MKSDAVMIIIESSAVQTIEELGASIAQEDVLLKIIPDVEFSLMFGQTVNVELDLETKVKNELMEIAHNKDITLNHLINQILLDKIQEAEFGMRLKAKAETSFEVKPLNLKDIKDEVNNSIIERSEDLSNLSDDDFDNINKLVDEALETK